VKISPDQIEVQKVAGRSSSDSPILYILTKGGLHAMFSKDKDGTTISLGASPHVAITKWLAEQRDPELKWNEDFIQKGEDFIDDLQKSEESRYVKLRNAIFSPVVSSPASTADAYIVYDTINKSFTVTDGEDLRKSAESGEIGRLTLIRHVSLTEPACVAEDHPEFSDLIRGTHGE
jgi:hypothetical protein